MAEFFNLLTTALETSVDKLFIVAWLTFLGVAIVGGTTPYIRPGKVGRIVGGLFGPVLIVLGLGISITRSSSIPVAPPIAPPVLARPLATSAPQAAPLATEAAPLATATPVHIPASTLTLRPAQISAHATPVVQQRGDQMSALLQTEVDYNRNARQIIDSIGR